MGNPTTPSSHNCKFIKVKVYLTFNLPCCVYQERYGLMGMIARRRAGLPTVPLGREAEFTAPPTPAVATETVEELPDHFLTQAPVLTQSE